MFKFLVLLFVIKLYARNNISKRIKKKHGQDILSHVRSLENLKSKYMKVTVINFKLLLDLFDIVFTLVNIVRKFYSVDDFSTGKSKYKFLNKIYHCIWLFNKCLSSFHCFL